MQSPLIELHNVDVVLQGMTVLRDLSWELRPGEHWAVLGGNGSGKSTFLRLIRGEIWPAPGKGERIYRLTGERQHTAVGVRERFALVSPELHDRYLQQEWRLTALQAVESGFGLGDYAYRKLTAAERNAAREMLRLLGVEKLASSDVQRLSTGELRKVLIARALVARPPILALDEACDGLDTPSRIDLLSRLENIARSGTQLLFVTHRREEILPSIRNVLVLQDGRIRETTTREAITRPQVVTRRLGSATIPAVAKKRPKRPARTLIRIEGADVFLERRRVLRNINWEIRSDQHWAVIGRNGAGKTTLLKLAFSDLYPAWGGKVTRFEFTARNTIRQVRSKLGFVSPELQANYRRAATGFEIVASGFFDSIGLHDRLTPRQTRRAKALIEQFVEPDLAQKTGLQMSYGELRKMLLLRAIVHEPELLICDEPFDGLDAAARVDFGWMLDALMAVAGARLVLVTHHVGYLPQRITDGLLLEHGEIVKQGAMEEIRADPLTKRFFEVL